MLDHIDLLPEKGKFQIYYLVFHPLKEVSATPSLIDWYLILKVSCYRLEPQNLKMLESSLLNESFSKFLILFVLTEITVATSNSRYNLKREAFEIKYNLTPDTPDRW